MPRIDAGKWMAARASASRRNQPASKGTLTVGADADVVVFDPHATWTVTRNDLHFRHKISPYLGAKLHGRVQETWLRGEQIFHCRSLRRQPARQRAGAPVSDRARRAIEECRLIATMTEEPGRITRRFLTPPFRQVHAHLRARMERLGMTVRVDAVGNLRGLWEPNRAASNKRLILGSHIDTVPDAGAFDGVLGVVLALDLVESAKALRLPLAIEIIAFSEEEGVRFGFPFIGSRAVAGRFDPAAIRLQGRRRNFDPRCYHSLRSRS